MEIHNLIGDYQRPPEVPENTGNIQNGNNMGQQPLEAYPILNQQWEGPTTYAGTNGTHDVYSKNNAIQKVRPPCQDVLTNSTTSTNQQVKTNFTGANLVQRDSVENSSWSQGSGTVSTNTTSRGVRTIHVGWTDNGNSGNK